MTYKQTIDYLYNTLPMFSRLGSAAFKKDLTNISKLCAFLGQPQNNFKTIHVGGTNGKGSVSHMLAAALQTAGYKTGLYTSPHIKDFRERIRINGQKVSEAFVVQFVEKIKPLSQSIEPSFFEITVAMAFEYFAEQEVDVAVIEVGLGGRLDSTNIIEPELSIITNISMDHVAMLGDNLQQIASEKAGIIKPEIPVVVGEKHKDTNAVFIKAAAQNNAPLYFAEDHFSTDRFCLSPNAISIDIQKENEAFGTYVLDLPGIYQTKNLVTVLQAVEVLRTRGFLLEDEEVKQALQQTVRITDLQGRWQVVRHKPTVVLEVAHNEDGIVQMLAHLKQLQYRQLHLVVGMVKDKEIESVLKHLPTDALYYFTQAQIPRALPAADLKGKASVFQLQGNVHKDVNAALKAALQKAAPNDLVIVCGSIFLVAEVETASLKR